jgi:tryptophan-rich sensory protein
MERFKKYSLFFFIGGVGYAVLELLWYPTLFGSSLVFLSVLESILILCLAICVTLCFYRVTKFAGMILLLHDIWLIYLLILNFAILFHA